MARAPRAPRKERLKSNKLGPGRSEISLKWQPCTAQRNLMNEFKSVDDVNNSKDDLSKCFSEMKF